MNRSAIRARFPWAFEPNQSMVVGTDLDATLSSVLAHHVLGWRVVGYYDLSRVHAETVSPALFDAVWLDLDISRPAIRSIGHHVLGIDGDPIPAHAASLNPNELCGVSRKNYARKYPLATFHLLCWLWEIPLPDADPLALPLCWLPDSAHVNARPDKYARNVAAWLETMPVLSLADVPTLDFAPLHARLESCGWPRANAQCRFDRPDPARLNALYATLSAITGWDAPTCPAALQTLPGRRVNTKIALSSNAALSAFLERERVFSYAFPFQDEINYTVF